MAHADQAPAPSSPPTPARPLAWLVGGGWVDRGKAQAAFDRMHRRDAIGDRVHLVLAMLGAAALAGPTTAAELAFAPLLVFFFVRVVNAGPTWIHWLGQPLMLGALALAAWQGVGLLWSRDPGMGLDHMSSLRWVMLGLLVWPAIEHRRAIVLALAAGFVLGNLAQAGHAAGRAWGIDWLTWPRYRHRNSGWWDPVVGGSLLVAALGLHLPAALMGRGRERWVAAGLACATGVALLATGTRGAWIAAAGLVVVGVAVAAATWRWRGAAPVRARGVLIGAVVVLVVAGVAWAALGPSIARRAGKARAEVAAALEGDAASDTGRRIEMLQWAARAFGANPVAGVGTGGYRAWVEERAPGVNVHDHAHNAYLDVAANNGVIGLLLAGFVVAAAVRGGARGLDGRSLGSYEAAPLFGLAGLLLAGVFDAVHVNAQTAAVMGLLAGLCPCWRPARRDAERKKQRLERDGLEGRDG